MLLSCFDVLMKNEIKAKKKKIDLRYFKIKKLKLKFNLKLGSKFFLDIKNIKMIWSEMSIQSLTSY